MKPTTLLLVSVFITAVVLAVIGGVTNNVLASKSTDQSAVMQQTLQAYQEREAAYSQLIQQANQQLEKANADLQAAQAQGVILPSQTAAQGAQVVSASFTVSVDQADQIARKVADPTQQMTKPGELVQFQGKAAYEVTFDGGSVYVDAQNGTVLLNGTIPQQITADMAVKVASDYLHDNNVLQVDTITFRGQQLYRVIFKNGTMLYMDMTGQITYINKGVPADQLQANAGGGGGGGGGGGEHESGD